MEITYYYAASIWMTVLTAKYSAPLLEQLVKKGYVISSTDPSGQIAIGMKDSVSYVIAITISKPNTILTASIVMKDIIESLYNIKAFYYSIITLIGTDFSCVPGNIIVEYHQTSPINPPSKVKNHLRLVKEETTIDKPNA